MASFYAELQVAGATYPVQHCTYEFTQATSERGRVAAKVRHGLVQLVLDVPTDDKLLDWAHTPNKPLAGRVIFYDAKGGPILEALTWEDGQCVGYQEEFVSGSVAEGAYVCHLTIAAPKLMLQPGGPLAYVAPAPGEHGMPPLAGASVLAAEEELVATLLEVVAEPTLAELLLSAGATLEEGLAAIAAVVATPVLLTLGLILGSSTPAGGPGIPHPPLLPINPDELRLQELVVRHAAGTLTPNEEADLITLLAKVKGIHIQSLNDLNVRGPLRGDMIHLPGFHNVPLTYIRRMRTGKRYVESLILVIAKIS
jgi:hypothetical protein